MTQVWVKTSLGDIMRLGDAQKARKKDAGLTYEVIGTNDGRGWQVGDTAAPRLHASRGNVKSTAIIGAGSDGGKPLGGKHPDEAMGGMGQETRRKRGRPRRNAGSGA